MQIFSSPNHAAPADIVNATIEAFNQRSAVQAKQVSAIDEGRFLANDPLYVEVGPYNVFYRTCVALGAATDKDQTKTLFGLNDAQIDAITKRVKSSLETGHKDTWAALNEIEYKVKRMAYTLPELAQAKPVVTKEEPKELTRSYRPSIKIEPLHLQEPAPVQKTIKYPTATPRAEAATERTLTRAQQIESEAKPSKDLAQAAAQKKEDKKPVERKKREELTLSQDVTGLNLVTISTKLHRLYEELGFGHVSKEEFSNTKFATENSLKLRGLIAYTAFRALPSTNHNLDRISSAAFLNRSSVSTILSVIEKKIENNDQQTMKFLRAAGNELSLTDHQKALLLDPREPRFKTWHDLQDILKPKGQTSLQTPEGP